MMWPILSSNNISVIYAALFLIPFSAAYFISRLVAFFRGL